MTIRAAATVSAGQIPVLPANAQRVMELAFDDFVELGALAAVLERDPAIAARIISLANSAFFAVGSTVLDLRDAVVRVLGLDLTRGVALGMALHGTMDVSHCPAFDVNRFWRSALATSAAAEHLTKALPGEPRRIALAGLLHNAGLLTLVAARPLEMQRALHARSQPLHAAMQAAIGQSSVAATVQALEYWQLPGSLQELLKEALTPGHMPSDPEAACLKVAYEARLDPDALSLPGEQRERCLDMLAQAGVEPPELAPLGGIIRRAWEAAGAIG